MSLLINHFYRFGDFSVDADQRVLLREGKAVPLAPKVFDTLLVLIENNGRIVQKEELMNRLWPNTFVEEANLTFNIQQLRKSLGDNARNPSYIETIARRGYRFIASVEEVLTDSRTLNEHHAQRIEIARTEPAAPISPVVSRDATYELDPPSPGPDPGPGSYSEERADRTSGANAASARTSKGPIAIAAALLIVLSVAGFFVGRIATGSNKYSGGSSRADGKASGIQPLKLEKLTGTGQSRQVAISPDGKYVAYTRTFGNKTGIWLRQLATGTNVEIVPAAGVILGLAFTNSGDSIYFVKGDPTALYRVSLVGGVVTKIVERVEGDFSISSDDRQIAVVRQVINPEGQREYSLIVANSDGSGERTVFVGTYPKGVDVPVWSPDDQSIICSYGYSEGGGQDVSLIQINVADGVKKELSAGAFFHIEKLAWLPHKSGLAMAARKNYGDNNQLWRLTYPGMEISQLTEELSSYLDLSFASNVDVGVASQTTRVSSIWVGSSREPNNLSRITEAIDDFCWLPNGRLVYLSTASGNGDIWSMQPDGSEQRQLTVDPGVDLSPTASPDNRYVVFISNRTGTFQVWRMDIDGGNQIRLTDGSAKDYPAISPDGRWIFYNSTDNWQLWRVSMDGGEPLRLTDFFAHRPAVSPDGKMIACLGRDQAKGELLILPFEGGQAIKRFDLNGSGSRLQWTPDNKALIYVVKGIGRASLMKQPLDRNSPENITDFEKEELFDFGYSFDHQSLAITRGAWMHDVVLISDLDRR